MTGFSTTPGSEPTTKETILEQIIEVVGDHALDTVSPNPAPITPISPAPPSAPKDDFTPSCVTQRPIPPALRQSNNAAITVGLNRECPRWVPGSTLKWVGIKEGFETPEDADYAAQQLNMACKKWNEYDVGVKFEWIKDPADAAFALWYGGNHGGTLASAFFPNGNDMNMIMVYSAAFARPMWKDNLWKVFTHELGHVLGLRHEFAIDVNPFTGSAYEPANGAILGPRNKNSVMMYKNSPPEIQETDVESTKLFYALKGDNKGNLPMVGLTEVQDYEPM